MLKKHNKSKPRLICSLLLVNKLYNQVSAFYQNKAEKSMTSIVSLQKNIYSEKIPLSIRVLYILVCVSMKRFHGVSYANTSSPSAWG